MDRILQDIELIKSKALPAANANASTASIDIGISGLESVQVKLIANAVPALADGTTITYTFQDSEDDNTFAAITGLSTLVQTGAGGAGAAAASRVVYLPPAVRRYIRVNAAVANGGGDNTAVAFSFQLLV